MKRAIASALVLALCVGMAAAAQAREPQRAGAARAVNSLVASVTNVTPPDRVGYDVSLKFEGQILAHSRKKNPKHCRRARDIEISNPSYPPGGVRTEYADPTPASGRFKVTMPPYEYGGVNPAYPEDGPRSGDIGYEGGTLTFQVVAKRLRISHYPRWYDTYLCKRLSATVSVQVPPAILD